MREWLVARGVHGHRPPVILPLEGPRILIETHTPLHGEIELPVHKPQSERCALRRPELRPATMGSFDGPAHVVCEGLMSQPAMRYPRKDLRIDSAIREIGGRFERWTPPVRGLPKTFLGEPAPGFRSSIRALPEICAPPRMSKTLARVPPVAWRPWRTGEPEGWNWHAPLTPGAAPPMEIRCSVRLPEFTAAPLTVSGLGIVQAALRGQTQRDMPTNRRPPCAGISAPAPGALLPVFCGALRSSERNPFRKPSGDQSLRQVGCPPAPMLAAPAALPLPAFSVRPPKAIRLGDNVVVMPLGRQGGAGRPFEYQPPEEAFREFRIAPVPARALPVLLLAPHEFPAEASA